MLSDDVPSASDRKRKHEDEPPHTAKMIKTAEATTQTPRFISREGMAMIKAQISQLTIKNRKMKESMQEMRESIVADLMSIMKTRRIVIEQLGKGNIESIMLETFQELLAKRATHLIKKEEELITLEDLLGGHEAVLEHAASACEELEEKIKIIELLHADPTFAMTDLPQTSALARISGGECDAKWSFDPAEAAGEIDSPQPNFTPFGNLPTEIRLQIWEACLPGSRVITHDSRHNRELQLLSVCKESRKVVEAKYTRVLSPGAYFPLTPTNIIYIDPDIDIVVRDLTIPSDERGSVFDLEGPSFNLRCFVMFTGLAKVKHLALCFDIPNENGEELFGPLQTCCPSLESLIIFPSSQLRGLSRRERIPRSYELRFIDSDSNLRDLVSYRRDRYSDRTLKRKALRGLDTLDTLCAHSVRYADAFPSYIEKFGQNWNPTIKVCLLAKWNEYWKGWQTRYMATDRYSKGFPGEDGRIYRGFIESGLVSDVDGEILSRYEGIRELFGDL